MSGVTLAPIISCNMSCEGCYEGKLFQVGDSKTYDIDRMLESIDRGPAGDVTLHGGEFTLMPVGDMRTLMAAISQRGRRIRLQTNATLITDRHVELFVEHQVGIGVSLNGPGELNADRSDERQTQRVHLALTKLRQASLDVGVICVLSQTNAGRHRLHTLSEWARWLGIGLGIWSVRFNMMYGGRTQLEPAEAASVYIYLAGRTLEDVRTQWLPFREMIDNLWGLGLQPCWVNYCDVYATDAVYAVFGDGSTGNCLRTSSVDGIGYLRDTVRQDIREQILSRIPVAENGCQGCRWWRVCHGGCPAEAQNDDWRNKSRFCEMYMDTYRYLTERMQAMLPNFVPYPDWTTNDEKSLERSVIDRKPLISAMMPATEWSVRPSTWMNSARQPR